MRIELGMRVRLATWGSSNSFFTIIAVSCIFWYTYCNLVLDDSNLNFWVSFERKKDASSSCPSASNIAQTTYQF
jgi:hypothetical protein